MISMSGSVTHEVAQYINNIIQPNIDSTYVLRSSDELLLHLNQLSIGPEEKMVSLDVESLFTNVPFMETVGIIVQAAYNHPTLPAPSLPSHVLQELLIICTTETPVQFRGETYVQIDGVSMGFPLGPTFAADFYM